MLHKIYACEKNYLLDYLNKTENFDLKNISDEKQAIFFKEQEKRSSRLMSINDGIARIRINGPLSINGPSYIDWLYGFGGTSYTDIIDAIQTADENQNIEKIILEMDTPGGQVDGVDSVHFAIKACGKEVIAENHGMIASAGYWIASACSKIVSKEQTAETGSIGVIIVGLDFKKAREDFGVKLVRIISKNAPNKAASIEEDKGIKLLQERVDSIERIFIKRVAEGRGVDEKHVIEKFGKGGIFISLDPESKKADAISIGMIDSLDINGEIFTKESIDAHSSEKNIKKNIDDSFESNDNREDSSENLEQEDKMKFKEYLEKHPEAKEDINKMVGEMVAKKVNENTIANDEKIAKEDADKTAKANIKSAKKYLTKDYPEAIQNLAIEVIAGNENISALEAAASAVDSVKEKESIENAETETNKAGETLPDPPKTESDNGQISSEEEYQAGLDRFKNAQGRK